MRKTKAQKNIRLSPHVIPEHYDLHLKPDLEAFTFQGEEAISLFLTRQATEITLHAAEISIETAEMEVEGKKLLARKISYDEKGETATFLFPAPIPKGKAMLRLVFQGILNDQMRGFYRSRFEHGGTTKHLATTQFEATDARRAFPCFDEPAIKAVFDISLSVQDHLTVISNTLPVETVASGDGYKRIQFASTPKMSTYLAAFVVGELESIEKKTKDGVLVRIFTTPGKKHQAEFALESAVRTVSFYNEYFGIPYPLNTLDLIAIPDFPMGAMENWGLITYRESALLVDAEHSSLANKQWVAIVIAHEIAHQWFGNLVTMKWWTDLWLNEGFATYAEYLAVDALFPKWNIWQQFLSHDVCTALSGDSLLTTHPIEVVVQHPGEINEIFDHISYMKGASIIRMLADYLGENAFRKGLSAYLKKWSFRNAETADLWSALEHASGVPVSKIMSGWTKKGGYPVIEVSEKNKKISLAQKRFFLSPLSEKKQKDTAVWNIPILYGASYNKTQRALLVKKSMQIAKPAGECAKLNLGESGFFRVSYPAHALLSFSKRIRSGDFLPADRLGLLRDLFALAEAGKTSSDQLFTFLSSYQNETDYSVWSEIVGGLIQIFSLISDQSFLAEYQEFALQFLRKIGNRVGFEKKKVENHSDTLLRSLILSAQSLFGDEKIITFSKTLFLQPDKKKTLDPDLRGAVYATVARYGNARDHECFLKMYRAETLQEEKGRITRALGAFRDENLIRKTLEFSLSKDVRAQDTVSMLALVFHNPFARDIAWKFLKENWKVLLDRYGAAGWMLPRLIAILESFDSFEAVKDIETFFKKYSLPSATRTISQVLEKVRANAMWKERLVKELPEFFEAKKK